MTEESKAIQARPNWQALEEKAKERALQFMVDPELDDYAKEFILGSLSENTLRAYKADLKIFRYWCEQRGFDPLPATPQVISNFLAAQANDKMADFKAITIIRRTCAIRYIHQMAGINPLPSDDMLVRKTLRGIMRKKLTAPEQKKAATADLIKMMADLTDESPFGIRDRAILLLGFAGAFRRSELVAIRVEDIEITDKGMTVFIRKSKTDQTGEGVKKPILRGDSHCPVTALQRWLTVANIHEGYVFKKLFKSGLAYGNNDPEKPDLSDKAVVRTIKKYADIIGLDPIGFAGHSLRRGFITSSLLAGASIAKTMEVTGQKDPKTVMRYYDDIKKFDDHAAKGLL